MLNDGDQNNSAGTVSDDAGASGDQGNAGDGAGNGGDSPTLESLQQQLKESQEREQAVSMRLLDPNYAAFLAEQRAGGRQARPAAEPKKAVDPLEGLTDEKLSAMSNRELLATAVERAVELVSSRLKDEFLPEIEQRMSSLGESVADQAAKREVAEAAAKFPDFWKHQKDMVTLSMLPKYEGLGAEDLYMLVKAQKGEAVVANKPGGSSRPTPGQRTSAAAHTDKPGSTGGGGAATGKGKAGEMSAEEAASDAWEKVFGKK